MSLARPDVLTAKLSSESSESGESDSSSHSENSENSDVEDPLSRRSTTRPTLGCMYLIRETPSLFAKLDLSTERTLRDVFDYRALINSIYAMMNGAELLNLEEPVFFEWVVPATDKTIWFYVTPEKEWKPGLYQKFQERFEVLNSGLQEKNRSRTSNL